MQTTFPRLLLKHAAERPEAAAMREKEFGIWQTLNWADLRELVADIAGVLSQNRRVLGMMPHPERAVEAAHGGTDGAALFGGLALAAETMVQQA